MKKILMIAERVPFPSDNGGKLRTANTMIHLSKHYDVDFVAYSQTAVSQEQMAEMNRYCRKIFTFPEGFPTSKKHLKDFITGKSMIAGAIYSANMQENIDQLLRDNEYQMIWVERLFCMPYVENHLKKSSKKSPVILNMHDVDHEAVLFFSKISPSFIKRLYYRIEYSRVLHLERASFRKAHRIIACSERDCKLYCERFPAYREKWFTANNGVDLEIARSLPEVQRDPATVLFVGGLDNPCNRQGILWFLHDVWGKVINRCPAAQLLIAGSGKSTEKLIQQAKNAKNVTFLGYVKDVNPLYQTASCIIVPLHSGSGTRLKIVEAFSFKLPVVSTSIGAEGIPAENGKALLIADDADGFAENIVEILTDKELRSKLLPEGYGIAEKYYDWNIIMDKLIREVDDSL